MLCKIKKKHNKSMIHVYDTSVCNCKNPNENVKGLENLKAFHIDFRLNKK